MNLIGIQTFARVNHFFPGCFGLGNESQSLLR